MSELRSAQSLRRLSNLKFPPSVISQTKVPRRFMTPPGCCTRHYGNPLICVWPDKTCAVFNRRPAARYQDLYPAGVKQALNKSKAWSPRRALPNRPRPLLPLKPGIRSLFVIHQTSGSKYQRYGFNSRWRDAEVTAQEKNPPADELPLSHDLKAKGVSDDLEGSLEGETGYFRTQNSRQNSDLRQEN